MVSKVLITVLACAVMSTGCQNKSPEPAPLSSSSPAPKHAAGDRRVSTSRSAYIQSTQKAREAAKATLAKQRLEPANPSNPTPGAVIYQGPPGKIPREALRGRDHSVEIHKNRPGEVTVRKRS